MSGTIIHSEQTSRGEFALERDGRRVGLMTYMRLDASHILIDHTHVDMELRGQGAARRLLDAAVAWARQTGTKISASCSYVVVQFARDPSLRDVQADTSGSDPR